MSTIKCNKWLNSDGTENFKCRAWVNFNGTGTVAIRASGNVSSITDNGTGNYTINFTNLMLDANYCIAESVRGDVPNDYGTVYSANPTSTDIKTVSQYQTRSRYANYSSSAGVDSPEICLSFYR